MILEMIAKIYKLFLLGIVLFSVIYLLLHLLLPVNLKLRYHGFEKTESYYYNSDALIDYRIYLKDGKLYSFQYEIDVVINYTDTNVEYTYLLENILQPTVNFKNGEEMISCEVNLVSENHDCNDYLDNETANLLQDKAQGIYFVISNDFEWSKIPSHQKYK